jgi:Tol biopolymer transport system component
MARLALLTTLALLALASPAAATFPGRNGALVYSQTTASGDSAPLTETSAILAQRSRPAEPRVIVKCERTDGTQTGGDCTSTSFYSLAFSPDGRLIAFDAGDRIGLVSVAGGPVTLLPGVTDNDGDPAFTPDGKRIVFTGTNDHGTTDLYTRRVDASDTARLLIEDARQPAFSVRGVLAYVRGDNVYVRLARHGGRRLVTSGVSPDWSPDGRRLAIIRPRPTLTTDSDIGRIYTVRANGRGLTRVGREGYASSPVWSPDGRWIAYDGFDLGVHVKLVGTHAQAKEWAPTQVSGESGSVVSSSPAWRPRPRR